MVLLLLSSFSTTVDSRTTSLESLLSMKVAPLLLHNMLLLSALLPYAVKASVFLLHDLHSSIVCIWMHLDNYWQGQHLYRGQPNILYDPIDFKGPSFFAGLQESCLTLFAKLRQSHNLPKLDWHTGSKRRRVPSPTHISAGSHSKEILFQAHSMAWQWKWGRCSWRIWCNNAVAVAHRSGNCRMPLLLLRFENFLLSPPFKCGY